MTDSTKSKRSTLLVLLGFTFAAAPLSVVGAASWDVSATFHRPGDEVASIPAVFLDEGAGHFTAALANDVGRIELKRSENHVSVTSHVESTLGEIEELQSITGATVYVSLAVDRPTLVDVWIDADTLFGAPSFALAYPGNVAHYAYDFYDGWTDCNFPVEPPPGEQFECSGYASLGYMVDWEERLLLEPGQYRFAAEFASAYHARYRIPISGDSSYAIDVVEPGSFCDVNGDQVCDASDIDAISNAVRTGSFSESLDLNLDGQLDTIDRERFVRAGMGSLYGDSDLDGRFDSSDLIVAFKAAKYERFADAGWADGDWNGDGRFDSGDLIFALTNSSYVASAESASGEGPQTVPEPVLSFGFWLLLSGVELARRKRTP